MGGVLEPKAVIRPKDAAVGNVGGSALAVAGNNRPIENPDVPHAWDKPCGEGGNDPN